MQPNSKSVVLLAIAGLLAAAVVLVYAYYVLTSGSDTVADSEVSQIQATTSQTVAVINETETSATDWQQPFIEQTSVYDVSTSTITATDDAEESETGAETIMLIEDISQPANTAPVSIAPEPVGPVVVNTSPPPARHKLPTPPVTQLPRLAVGQATDCGEVTIDATFFGLLDFIGSAATNPPIVCLGEQVGASCDTGFFSTSDGMRVYVAEGDEFACGIGISAAADTVLLCDLLSFVPSNPDGITSWSVIERQFAAEPGPMMALLIEDNYMSFIGGTVDTTSCAEYQLE